MENQQFSIVINAPKKKVWNTMLNQDTYKIWTAPFMPGSYYDGQWKDGSKMLFLEKGKISGMVSQIKEIQPYEFISIEHKGIVEDGKEKEAPELKGSLEKYTFKEIEGETKVIVDLYGPGDIEEFEVDYWSKALQILKKLAEK